MKRTNKHGAKNADPKTEALFALKRFAHQRPGLDYGNYCSGGNDANGRRAYFSEARAIAKQLRRFKEIYAEALEYGVTDADLELDDKSGRLTWTGKEWDYCTGQYFPTEYRNAAANKLERAVSKAKARQFKPLSADREYSLDEMRAVAHRSGSFFFSNSEAGDKYRAEMGNKIVVIRRNKSWARYQFKPQTGSFDYIESNMTEGAKL